MSSKSDAQHILDQVESIKNSGSIYRDIVIELKEIEESARRIIRNEQSQD